MSALDTTGANTAIYKKIFADLNDEAFERWVKAFQKDEDHHFYLNAIP